MAYMIDIETFSTMPNAAIVQVGIVDFNPHSKPGVIRAKAQWNVTPDDDAHIDAETVKWWLGVGRRAPAATLLDAPGVSEGELAQKLKMFILQNTAPDEVWACPPSFDLVILESLFRRVGVRPPWGFRAPRCLRTLRTLTGAYLDDVRQQAMNLVRDRSGGGCHNALFDAEYQAIEVQLRTASLAANHPTG